MIHSWLHFDLLGAIADKPLSAACHDDESREGNVTRLRPPSFRLGRASAVGRLLSLLPFHPPIAFVGLRRG